MNNIHVISLTKGRFAIIDSADSPKVSGMSWQVTTNGGSNEYIKTTLRVEGKNVNRYLHRVITDAPRGMDVDHIDGNGFNNMRENLRLCTRGQNLANRNLDKVRGGMGYLGVTWFKPRGKWKAAVGHNYKEHFVGYFDDPQEAAIARDRMAIALHGEFASLNFPTHKQLRDTCRMCLGTGEITVSDGHGCVDFDACPRCSWFEPYTDDYPAEDDAMEVNF